MNCPCIGGGRPSSQPPTTTIAWYPRTPSSAATLQARASRENPAPIRIEPNPATAPAAPHSSSSRLRMSMRSSCTTWAYALDESHQRDAAVRARAERFEELRKETATP